MELIFLVAYFLTISIETSLLVLLLRKDFAFSSIVRNSFIANTFTLLFVWFVFPFLGNILGYPMQIFLSELFAFLVEATIYSKLFNIKLNQALKVSFICNMVSFLIGLILLSNI